MKVQGNCSYECEHKLHGRTCAVPGSFMAAALSQCHSSLASTITNRAALKHRTSLKMDKQSSVLMGYIQGPFAAGLYGPEQHSSQ